MKIHTCGTHDTLLRQQVDNLGLLHLVANTPEEMQTIIRKCLDGTYDSIKDFDPLLFVNFSVFNVALQVYGPNYMVSLDDDGSSRCALCEHELHDGQIDEWLHIILNTTLIEARRLGLAPTLQ